MASLQKYHDDFYVYLVSNSNPNLYPENTASSFINEIQVPINFGSNTDEWEVGISELLFPSKFFNITEGVNEFKVRYPLTNEQARERRSQRARVLSLAQQQVLDRHLARKGLYEVELRLHNFLSQPYPPKWPFEESVFPSFYKYVVPPMPDHQTGPDFDRWYHNMWWNFKDLKFEKRAKRETSVGLYKQRQKFQMPPKKHKS